MASSVPLRGLAVLLSLAFAAGALSGCLSAGKEDAPPVAPPRQALSFVGRDVGAEIANAVRLQQDLHFETNVTIHVVLVGTPDGLYDEERIRAQMSPFMSPFVAFDNLVGGDGWRSPLMFRFNYEFHRAPDAFGKELFSYAVSIAEQREPNDFLKRYDSLYEKRLSEGEKVALFDGPLVEAWIVENRARYGLEFADPENTLFVLDSYTNGWWPHDTYYWYKYDDVIAASDASRTLRVWGGGSDLLFYDVSAAPNGESDDKSSPCDLFPVNWLNPAPAPEGTAYHDPPVWHYDGQGKATVGVVPVEYREVDIGADTGVCAGTQRTIDATEVLTTNIQTAVHLRFFPTYLYPPIYKPVYQINMHLYHDGLSIIPKTLEEYADFDVMMEGLQQQIPWAEIRGNLKTYVLPDDDPGMNEALTLAKAHGAGTYIPAVPVMNYIDANPGKFIDPDPDVFNVKAFFFILQGHYTFYLPAIVGGVALGDVEGQAWGTISNINDRAWLQGSDPGDAFVGINLHEIGHFFGLRHPHDGDVVTPEGDYRSVSTDFTWGSISSALSYRIRSYTSDDQDRDSIARAHFYQNVRAALRESESTYRLLADQGIQFTPAPLVARLKAAEESVNTAVRLFEEGRWIDSVHAALDASRLAREALEAAGSAPLVEAKVTEWEASGVSSRGVKGYAVGWTYGVTGPQGPHVDYKEVSLPREVESVRVKVTFENTPESWGDLFVGWNLPIYQAALIEFAEANMVQLAPFGVHDYVDENPMTGAAVLEHTIHLDRFPVLRDLGSILVGAGALGPAENAAYRVEVFATYRSWGANAGPGELLGDGSNYDIGRWHELAHGTTLDALSMTDARGVSLLAGHAHL